MCSWSNWWKSYLCIPMWGQMTSISKSKGLFLSKLPFYCTWNLLLTFGLTGWEGSVSDAKIYASAVHKHKLRIPEGWYYLADAGFPHSMELLIPFCGTRYHLAEWGRANPRYLSLVNDTSGNFLVKKKIGQKHHKGYLIYNMLKPEMLLNAYLEFSKSVFAFFI